MKKALYAVAVIATVTIAGWNYQQNKEVELSDLAMENVEALAQGESDEDFMKQQVAMQQSVQKFVVHTFMHQKQTVHVIYVTK